MIRRVRGTGTGRAGPGLARDTGGKQALGPGPEHLDIVPLGLTHRIYPDGHAVVVVRGELDAATADQTSGYIRQIIDRAPGGVVVDLAGLSFCDARGLRALVQIAAHARTTGREVTLSAVRPPIMKIMRITGIDAVFARGGDPPKPPATPRGGTGRTPAARPGRWPGTRWAGTEFPP